MIKRIRLAARAGGVDAPLFPDAWATAASEPVNAPPDIRPVRIAVCPCLPRMGDSAAHDGVGIEWFSDVDHLSRFEAWLQSPSGGAVAEALERALSLPDSPVMAAEEVIVRGADWLARRWTDGGDRIKQMAVARRVTGLTSEAFSERWRSRAGSLGTGTGATVVIPDWARGRAYLQNHPLAAPAGGWPYDAVNEVYFEDEVSLAARVEWFARNMRGGAESDLVSVSHFLATREIVVWDATVQAGLTDRGGAVVPMKSERSLTRLAPRR